MKKALLVTYDFPPCSAPGAAMRTEKLAQYLPEFGWDVAVLCRDEGRAQNRGEPAAARPEVVRIRTPISPRLSYQLGAWVWARRMLPRARALLREARPDLVYASGPPFPHVLSAVRLAGEAGIPVVVDFRDAWSLDPHSSGGRIKQAAKRGLCRWVYPRFEQWIFESADAIILNTPSMRRAYAARFDRAEPRLHLVPNGFDDGDFQEPVEIPPRERPLLLYCGRLSSVGGRSPEALLRGVRAVIDAGRPIDLLILGDDSAALRRYVRRFGLQGSVRTRASLSNREAIRTMRAADILIVYQAPSRSEVTPVAGKTFEYLRSGRPILAVVPPGDNADLVRRYAAVYALVTTEDPASVAAGIRDLLNRAARAVSTTPDPEFLETYARRHIAERVAAIFYAALDRHTAP
jgi:glycosyltransferase involved in cell wall biosynthesis